MNEEKLRKLCKEEFLKNIKENIKSETIFTYVDGLEKENKKQKEVLDKIKEKVNQYEFISGYYDYIEENGYAETTSHDTLKEDILELLEEIE